MSHERLKPLFEDPTASSELRSFIELARSDGASQADLDRFAKRMAPVLGVSAALVASSAAAGGTAPVAAASAFGAPGSGLTPGLSGALASAKLGAAKVGLASQLLASASAKVVAVSLGLGVAGVGAYSMTTLERSVPRARPVARQAGMAQPSLPASSRRELAAEASGAPLPQQAAAVDGREAAPIVTQFAPRAPLAAAARAPGQARQELVARRPVAPAPEPVAATIEQPITDLPTAAEGVSADKPSATPSLPPPSELSLIERAEADREHYDQALAFLAKHEQHYPRGALAQEREVLAIELLLKAGKLSQAEARAGHFQDDFPRSAHLPRVHALLSRARAK